MRDSANAVFKQVPVEGDELRHVGHGVLRQARRPRREQRVAWRFRPMQIAGEGNAKRRGHFASIQGVALDDDYRPPESGA